MPNPCIAKAFTELKTALNLAILIQYSQDNPDKTIV